MNQQTKKLYFRKLKRCLQYDINIAVTVIIVIAVVAVVLITAPNIRWARQVPCTTSNLLFLFANKASILQWKAGTAVSWESYLQLLSIRYQVVSVLIPCVVASWKSGGLPDWTWGFHMNSNENKEHIVEILKLTHNYCKHFQFQNEILHF